MKKKFLVALAAIIALTIPVATFAGSSEPIQEARGGYGDWPV